MKPMKPETRSQSHDEKHAGVLRQVLDCLGLSSARWALPDEKQGFQAGVLTFGSKKRLMADQSPLPPLNLTCCFPLQHHLPEGAFHITYLYQNLNSTSVCKPKAPLQQQV